MASHLENYIKIDDKIGSIVNLMGGKIFEPGTSLNILYSRYDLEQNKTLMDRILREIMDSCTTSKEDKDFFCLGLIVLLFNLKGDIYELGTANQQLKAEMIDYIEQIRILNESCKFKDNKIKSNAEKYFQQVKKWAEKSKQDSDYIELLKKNIHDANLENDKLKDTISQLSLKNISLEDELDKERTKNNLPNSKLASYKNKISNLQKNLETSNKLVDSSNNKIIHLENMVIEQKNLLETQNTVVHSAELKLLQQKLEEKDKLLETRNALVDSSTSKITHLVNLNKEKDKLLEARSTIDHSAELKLLQQKLEEKDNLLEENKINTVQLADFYEIKNKLEQAYTEINISSNKILELEEIIKSNSSEQQFPNQSTENTTQCENLNDHDNSNNKRRSRNKNRNIMNYHVNEEYIYQMQQMQQIQQMQYPYYYIVPYVYNPNIYYY